MRAKQFLELLFGRGVYEAPALIELRMIPPRWKSGPLKQEFHATIENALRTCSTTREGAIDIYYGVLPRMCALGTKTACWSGATLWIDIDLKDGLTSQEALELLKPRNSGLPHPTLIVCSGNGLHGYWLLNKATHDLPLLEDINRGIALCARGDSVSDCSRILRVPGTYNFKDRYDPKLVEVLSFRPLFYSVEDFEHLAVKVRDTEPSVKAITPSGVSLEPILTRLNERWRCLVIHGKESEYASDYDYDGSRIDFAVTCHLVSMGMSERDIATLFTDAGLAISTKALGKRGAARDTYIARTIRKSQQLVLEVPHATQESPRRNTQPTTLCPVR